MSSFQDLIVASFRVRERAAEFEQSTLQVAAQLRQQLACLSSISRGNRTAEGAVREVEKALKDVQVAASQLRKLQRELGDFISYVSQ